MATLLYNELRRAAVIAAGRSDSAAGLTPTMRPPCPDDRCCSCLLLYLRCSFLLLLTQIFVGGLALGSEWWAIALGTKQHSERSAPVQEHRQVENASVRLALISTRRFIVRV